MPELTERWSLADVPAVQLSCAYKGGKNTFNFNVGDGKNAVAAFAATARAVKKCSNGGCGEKPYYIRSDSTSFFGYQINDVARSDFPGVKKTLAGVFSGVQSDSHICMTPLLSTQFADVDPARVRQIASLLDKLVHWACGLQ